MKKTVSIIHYSSPPVIGGVEFVLAAQTRYLLSRNFQVKVISGKGENFLPEMQFVCIPEIYSLHPKVIEAQEALKKGKIEIFQNLKDYLEKRLEEETGNSEIIIYHNCLSMPFNMALTSACHSLIGNKKKNLVWIHDSPFFDPFYKSFLESIKLSQYPWNLLTFISPNVVYITITEERKREIMKTLGIPEENIKVIPNGIDMESFLSLSPEIVFLLKKIELLSPDYIGLLPARLIRRKNIEMGIRIIREMNNLEKKVILLITAPSDPHQVDNEYRREIKDLISNLKLEDKILLLSEFTLPDGTPISLSFKNLKGLYAISDFLLLPSILEGFGIPILEAGISRLPVFCSDLPTLREVGGRNVYYFAYNDTPQKIAKRILETLENISISRLFRKVKREFEWEKILDSHLLPLLEREN